MLAQPLRRVFLWGLVLVQLLVPLSYYFGWREPDDERFAWRMFSGVRMRKCSVSLVSPPGSVDGHAPNQPVTGLHASWLHALERGRTAVVARYLERACQGADDTRALARRCVTTRGAALPLETYRFDCATHRLVDDGAGSAR